MQTKISKDVLDSSDVSGYIQEKLPWVQYMDELPEDTTELLAKMPIGGLIITKEPASTSDSGKPYVKYVSSLPTDPTELAALENSLPDGGLLIVTGEEETPTA